MGVRARRASARRASKSKKLLCYAKSDLGSASAVKLLLRKSHTGRMLCFAELFRGYRTERLLLLLLSEAEQKLSS